MLVQEVRRWHMIRMRSEQSLAAHSYNVCMIAAKMARECSLGVDRAALMEWALCHDVSEIEEGDTPSPVKSGISAFWSSRGFEPPTMVRNIVRIADRIEAYLHFYHHGVDGVRRGVPISQYLLERVYVDNPYRTWTDNALEQGRRMYEKEV